MHSQRSKKWADIAEDFYLKTSDMNFTEKLMDVFQNWNKEQWDF